MPILGVIASSISGNLYSASFDSIATFTWTAEGSYTFSAIPQTYQHLQLRVSYRGNGGADDTWYMRFNGANTDYNAGHYLYGTGASIIGEMNTLSRSDLIANIFTTGSTSLANNYAGSVVDILDYTNTNKFKVTRQLGGYDNSGSGRITYTSGLWKSLNAITSITVGGYGTQPAAGTTFALYGIKGL